jgi:hypothetical protein
MRRASSRNQSLVIAARPSNCQEEVMKHKTFGVWISGLLIATLALGAIAPAAEARSKGSKRYKGAKYGARYHGSYGGYSPRRVVEVRRSSSVGPAIAGFIGGLVVGSVLTSAAERRAEERRVEYDPPPRYDSRDYDDGYDSYRPDYDYVDPYCDQHFSSLSSYPEHAYGHRHPVVVRVIEVRTGRCEHVYRYQRGDWVDAGGDWDRY